MKRFIFLILAVCLSVLFTLSGCSCTGDTILEFNSSNIKDIKKETLTYSVSLDKNYKEIKRSSEISDNILPNYINGLYVTEYETGVLAPVNNIDGDNPRGVINHLKTTFEIDVVDTKRNTDVSDDKTYNDQIISEVWFYGSEWSYAPIYSKTTVKNTYIGIDGNQIEFAHKIYQYTTTYKKSSYVMTKKYYAEDDGEDITGYINFDNLVAQKFVSIKGDGKSYEYEFRHVLDNNLLIFATRNLDISKGNSSILPIINYMYSNISNLQLINTSHSTLNIEQSFNYSSPTFNKSYSEGELAIPVKNLKITLSGTNYLGMPKYVSVQNNTADETNIANNSLIVEYAEALTTASYNCLGALVFRLNNVNLSYK